MQRKTSIGSRITWFAIAAIILFATCQTGLRILPAAAEVFGGFGIKLPRGTQAVFTFGPAVLVSVGMIAAVLIVMGEFTPALREIRLPLLFLVMVLMGTLVAAVYTVPMISRGEAIDPRSPVSDSATQPTNAP